MLTGMVNVTQQALKGQRLHLKCLAALILSSHADSYIDVATYLHSTFTAYADRRSCQFKAALCEPAAPDSSLQQACLVHLQQAPSDLAHQDDRPH